VSLKLITLELHYFENKVLFVFSFADFVCLLFFRWATTALRRKDQACGMLKGASYGDSTSLLILKSHVGRKKINKYFFFFFLNQVYCY
jgi:hypothetical protein